MSIPPVRDVYAEPGTLWHCYPPEGDTRSDDFHPWLVIRSVSDVDEATWVPLDVPGLVVYGTSQNTPALNGAPVELVERGNLRMGRGLTKDTTWFVGTRVQFVWASALKQKIGRISALETNRIHTMVMTALGLGTGSALRARERGVVSFRGTIVRLTEDAGHRLGADFALIVTAHEKSATRYFQLAVPVCEQHSSDPMHPDFDVHLEKALAGPLGWEAGVIVASRLASLVHTNDLAPKSVQPRVVVDEALLLRVDGALRAYLR